MDGNTLLRSCWRGGLEVSVLCGEVAAYLIRGSSVQRRGKCTVSGVNSVQGTAMGVSGEVVC